MLLQKHIKKYDSEEDNKTFKNNKTEETIPSNINCWWKYLSVQVIDKDLKFLPLKMKR
jgi:hypothetical protein